jgi:acyl carrier protein
MSTVNSSETTAPVTSEAIAAWLHNYIADLRGMKPARISRTEPFFKYGLDSASAVALTGDLMEWLKVDVDPSLLYEYPTIDRAAGRLATLANGT